MSLVVGLTGGIGSGKTAVSDRFAELGVPVIDTDVIAREVVKPGQSALHEIISEFGEDMLGADGSLNRERLRESVFGNTKALHRLEAITHPRIRERTLTLINNVDYPYCIVVVPLMVESGFTRLVDRVLVVIADRSHRLQWVEKRSGLSAEQTNAIIDSQVGDEERIAIADDVVENGSDLAALRDRVDQLHQQYLTLSGE